MLNHTEYGVVHILEHQVQFALPPEHLNTPELPWLAQACSLLQCKTVKFGLFLKVLLPTPRHFGVYNLVKQQTVQLQNYVIHFDTKYTQWIDSNRY